MERPDDRFPKRKNPRLKQYDYATENYYFVTICTGEKKCIFGSLNNMNIFGKFAEEGLLLIETHFPTVKVDKFIIMPNHVHLLLQIHAEEFGRPVAAPTISVVVNKLKGAVSRQVGFTVWQKGFYDHVVRAEQDYREIWHYIENNPYKWKEDRFYQVE